MTLPQGKENSNFKLRYLSIILLLVLFSSGLKLINLDADPPPWFTDEIGFKIDEGYKTLSPRNLAIFGKTHWNTEDEYSGWMTRSGITQWPYYWSFRIFGSELRNARLVSIFYFALLSLGAAWFLWRRLSPKAALIGVVLLVSDPGMFMFSRSALFETGLTLFTYVPLFIFFSAGATGSLTTIATYIFLTSAAFFYLKKTILIYAGPSVMALMYNWTRQSLFKIPAWVCLSAIALLGTTFLTVLLYKSPWIMSQINADTFSHGPQSLLLNPIHTLSPLALAMSYIVLLELLFRKPAAILDDNYRFCLMAIVILAPMAFALFTYNYPRYYIPIIPAAILLLVERLVIQLPETYYQKHTSNILQWFMIVITFFALTMEVLALVNYYFLNIIPFNIGGDPGLSDIGLYKVFPFACIAFIIFLYFIVRPLWLKHGTSVIVTLTIVHIVCGLSMAYFAVFKPTYQSKKVQSELVGNVGPNGIVGGDWAPFFATDTALKVLYMRPDINSGKIASKLRPDYFLDSTSPYDRKTLAQLRAQENLRLSPAIPLGVYANHAISLYPIIYLDGTNFPKATIKQ
jgi:hypothetical protein